MRLLRTPPNSWSTILATARAARSINTGSGVPAATARASMVRISSAETSFSAAGRWWVIMPLSSVLCPVIAGRDDKRDRQVAPVGQADGPARQVDGGRPLSRGIVQEDQRLAPAVA